MNESLYIKIGLPGVLYLEEVTKPASRDDEMFITGHVTIRNSRDLRLCYRTGIRTMQPKNRMNLIKKTN